MESKPWYQGTVAITVSNLNSGELKVMIFSINGTEASILKRILENDCNLLIGERKNKSKKTFWDGVPSSTIFVEVHVFYAVDSIDSIWLDEDQMKAKIEKLLRI